MATEKVGVTFLLTESHSARSTATIFITGGDSSYGDAVTWDLSKTSRLFEMMPGSYSAALKTESGYGPVARFTVEEAPVSVALSGIRTFDLRLGVIDTTSSMAVPDAVAKCRRVDLAEAWPQDPPPQVVTGPEGLATFEGLSFGDWEITVEKAGFETGRFKTPLPGPWEPHIHSNGFVDMQSFGITPLRTLTLQLTGTDGWDDLTLFTGNHSSQTPALAFDADGRLRLQLGAVATPLFLYVVYPDGQQTGLNLLGELPNEDDPMEIPVGGSSSLEVALNVTTEVRDALGESDCYLRVFFETDAGDTRRVRQKAPSDGTFVFHGVEGNQATVCFHVEANGERSDWVIREVALKDGEIARTTLNVENHPPQLQFVDKDGAPLPQLWTEFYVLPHESTWHQGSSTDDDGMTTAPRIEEGQVAFFAWQENGVFAVDSLLPEVTQGVVTQVKLYGTEPTFVEVTLDGQPAPHAYVEILGTRSGRSFDASYTNEHGRSRAVGLTRSSNANFQVILPGAWWDRGSDSLRTGLNRAALRSVGTLRAMSEQALRGAIYVDTGASVNDWVDAGLVQVAASELGGFTARLPSGRYVFHPGQETEESVSLAPGGSKSFGY